MNCIALLIPLLFSLQHILVRIGSEKSETLNGIYASLLVSTLMFSPSLLNPTLNQEFLLYMTLAGVLQFFLARICLYYAISRIGANLSAPLSSTRILFTTIIGLFVGELLNFWIIIGSVLIFTGIFLLSKVKGEPDWIGISLAILTGLFACLSSYFIRFGNAIEYNPFFAVFIGFAISTALLTPFMIGKSLKNTKPFVVGGALGGLAHMVRYIVLKDTPVTVIEPITSSHPLFTLVLTAIFLRRLEVFSRRSILGTISIMTGIYVLLLLK
ncbi:MAG: DMT family transporter [Archaeoglobaceae archaeon]